jgi:hypothetical protein
MKHIRGQIAYLSAARVETGREWFSVSIAADGHRTSRCECHFNDVGLLRDVSFTVDRAWRPIDAYLRISLQDKLLGSGWFAFDPQGVACHNMDEQGRVVSLRRDLPAGAPAFGAHPILNDGYWPAAFDLARPNQVQRLQNCVTYSKEMIGKEKIGIETFDLELSYAGEQDIEVAAGRFRCRAFSALIVGLAAPFKLWTWSDDYIIVKETWTEMPGSFELAKLG